MDIETIYRLYFRDVFLFLQGLTGSETLAEELTQETFFKALDGLKGFDGRQDVRAWLFTVARNAYYDHCRRAKRTAPLEAAADAAADERVHAVLHQKACQCAVTAAVGVNDFRMSDFAVRSFIKLELFGVAEMLKNLTVFIGNCNFHNGISFASFA